LTTGLITCPLNGSAKFDALTYDATLSFKPSEPVLLFGRFSHGYKSGGINLPTPLAPAPLAPDAYKVFQPEKVDSYEIGVKADFDVGVPLRLNLSGFYDDYKNIQVSQAVNTIDASGNVAAPQNIVRNTVRAKIKGIDFDATIVPVEWLSISGFFSYLDAAPSNTVAGVVTAGRQFAKQPKYKYGVSGVLTLPVGDDLGDVSASANWTWQSDVFNSNTTTLRPIDPSYGLLNARIDWNGVMNSGFDISLFANNLLDKKYILGGYPIAQLGFDGALYGEPRMYGISLRYRFGER
jgi:iron complex outermembrane receptor protein